MGRGNNVTQNVNYGPSTTPAGPRRCLRAQTFTLNTICTDFEPNFIETYSELSHSLSLLNFCWYLYFVPGPRKSKSSNSGF